MQNKMKSSLLVDSERIQICVLNEEEGVGGGLCTFSI